MTPPDPPISVDPIHAIEVAIWDALADALGRWAVAATARSPRFGSPIPACPDEPDEEAMRH